MEMEKREWLKEKQLMIFAKYGYWVTQSSLDEVFISDDKIILQQIDSLKELREQFPKLSKSINQDLFELQTNPNATGIKKYNEQYATGMRNDIEEELVNVLFWISIFENANLTLKQKQLLIDIVEGNGYKGKAKDYDFLCKKLSKSKGEKNKMSDKRVFTNEEMRKLFIGFYSKEDIYFDEHLNYNKKLECYTESVEQSKIRGDRIRSLSLKTAIIPLSLDNEVREND